jgi:hypothetical protein
MIFNRLQAPTYGIMVLNRLNVHNFIETIDEHLSIQHAHPYIICKHQQTIYGLWIYQQEDSQRLFQTLKNVELIINQQKKAPLPIRMSLSPPEHHPHVLPSTKEEKSIQLLLNSFDSSPPFQFHNKYQLRDYLLQLLHVRKKRLFLHVYQNLIPILVSISIA